MNKKLCLGVSILMLLTVPSGFVFAQTLAEKVEISRAWVRAVPPSAPNTSVYFTVENHMEEELRLIGVSSAAAEHVEIHMMNQVGETMQMFPITEVPMEPKTIVDFEPAGLHLMLIDLLEPLSVGDNVVIELQFEGKEERALFIAKVREDAPEK